MSNSTNRRDVGAKDSGEELVIYALCLPSESFAPTRMPGGSPSLLAGKTGAAYVLALVTLLVGMTLALAMIRSSSSSFYAENSRYRKRAALNIAEAGADCAYWQVHWNNQRLPYSADVSLGSGSFHVDATDDGSRQLSTMKIVTDIVPVIVSLFPIVCPGACDTRRP